TRDTNLAGRFGYSIDGTPIVYDQCDGDYTNHTIGPNLVLPEEQEGEDGSCEEMDYADDPAGIGFESKYTWIQYDNDFAVEEDTNTIPISYLEEPHSSYYQSSDG